MSRIVCTDCGGWLDQGIDAASFGQRAYQFGRAHQHMDGSPVVYRQPNMSDVARDGYAAVVQQLGLVHLGSAPVGNKWAIFTAPATTTLDKAVRSWASSPAELLRALGG